MHPTPSPALAIHAREHAARTRDGRSCPPLPLMPRAHRAPAILRRRVVLVPCWPAVEVALTVRRRS